MRPCLVLGNDNRLGVGSERDPTRLRNTAGKHRGRGWWWWCGASLDATVEQYHIAPRHGNRHFQLLLPPLLHPSPSPSSRAPAHALNPQSQTPSPTVSDPGRHLGSRAKHECQINITAALSAPHPVLPRGFLHHVCTSKTSTVPPTLCTLVQYTTAE